MKLYAIHYVILSIVLLSLGYGAYYFFKEKESSLTTHSNEMHFRQKLIKSIWESVNQDLETKGYLTNNKKLTDQGISFIIKVVKEKVQQESTKAEISLLEDLLTASIIASYSFLEWCPCILPAQRVDLAFQIIRDINKHFPNTKQSLTYVSLGAGDLLQDFVVMATLLDQGYCNLNFIGIDFNYQHITHITIADKTKLMISGINTSEVAKKVSDTMNAFTTQLEKRLANKPQLSCTLDIAPFTSAYTYIDAVAHALENKANVLIIADPTRYLPYLKVTNLSDANMIQFTDNGLLLIMSEQQKLKAYLPVTSTKLFFKEDIEKINELTYKTTDRFELKTALVAYAKKKGRSFTYYADPFITFQDLIRHTSTPTTIAYGLFEVPGISEPFAHKIDTQTFKMADVITPYIGRDLTSLERSTEKYQEIKLQHRLSE